MIGVMIPLVPILVAMASFATKLKLEPELYSTNNVTFISGGLGFGSYLFPPILCGAIESYYSTILPINIIVFIGLTELLLLFWTVYKVRSNNYKIMKHLPLVLQYSVCYAFRAPLCLFNAYYYYCML